MYRPYLRSGKPSRRPTMYPIPSPTIAPAAAASTTTTIKYLTLADERSRIAQCFYLMSEACSLIWSALVLLFRSRASLAAEILVLRHQINILRRHSPKRQTFSAMDRLIFAWLYRLAPTVLRSARDSAQGFRQLA